MWDIFSHFGEILDLFQGGNLLFVSTVVRHVLELGISMLAITQHRLVQLSGLFTMITVLYCIQYAFSLDQALRS